MSKLLIKNPVISIIKIELFVFFFRKCYCTEGKLLEAIKVH